MTSRKAGRIGHEAKVNECQNFVMLHVADSKWLAKQSYPMPGTWAEITRKSDFFPRLMWDAPAEREVGRALSRQGGVRAEARSARERIAEIRFGGRRQARELP